MKLQFPPANHICAYKAHSIIPFSDESPARGKELFSPLHIIENAWLTIGNGRIIEISKKKPIYKKCTYIDLGKVALLPAISNCHTHLQLSWLDKKLALGQGFTIWLKSLVKNLINYTTIDFPENCKIYLDKACKEIKKTGTSKVGDIGGSLPGSIKAIVKISKKNQLEAKLFCEHFGFSTPISIWPERCHKQIMESPQIEQFSSPCGHALYSTNPQTLQKAHNWCKNNKRPFTIHLAESEEETELLTYGSGALYNFYKDIVLPPKWKAPESTPFGYAQQLDILSPATIAVHCVHLQESEIKAFAKTGATICLCPRSNQAIGVGQAPVKKYMEENILICLGTDGLTSAPDLDIRNEAEFLHNNLDIPWQALWRMAISNGASALGFSKSILKIGQSGQFSIWPLP